MVWRTHPNFVALIQSFQVERSFPHLIFHHHHPFDGRVEPYRKDFRSKLVHVGICSLHFSTTLPRDFIPVSVYVSSKSKFIGKFLYWYVLVIVTTESSVSMQEVVPTCTTVVKPMNCVTNFEGIEKYGFLLSHHRPLWFSRLSRCPHTNRCQFQFASRTKVHFRRSLSSARFDRVERTCRSFWHEALESRTARTN